MAGRFNLADYETVEQRIRRFYETHPDGRIITENVSTLQDRQLATWVFKTTIFLDEGSQAAGLPKATGFASEVDGGSGANATSACENCETSSIGRALANMNLSGNKRASREEMAKVERGAEKPLVNIAGQVAAFVEAKDLEGLRKLYAQAERAGVPASTLKVITDGANGLKTAPDSAG
jgi:predicted TIM-barrel fold metal-dependent hydrolase